MSNETEPVFHTKDLSDADMQRLLLAIMYCPPSEMIMSKLVDWFSARPHKKANPGLDPESDAFIETMPPMPKPITMLYDLLNKRAIKVNKKWAAAALADPNNMPPKRYRRG